MNEGEVAGIGPFTSIVKVPAEFGVKSVHDLLQTNSIELATRINDRNFKHEVIEAWQIQARLCCEVPNLRGHDAQILVACGIREAGQLHGLDPRALFTRVDAFCDSPAGERLLRSSKRPDLAEVTFWIEQSQFARSLSAA